MVIYEQKNERNYDKIGGLLIVAAFALITTPLRIVALLSKSSSAETWHKLTSPDSELYHPWYRPLLIGEIVSNSIMLLFSIVLIVMLFQKYKYFPKLVITFLVLNITFGIANSSAIAIINDRVDFNLLPIPSAIVSILWIIYFLTSERVKQTFKHEKRSL